MKSKALNDLKMASLERGKVPRIFGSVSNKFRSLRVSQIIFLDHLTILWTGYKTLDRLQNFGQVTKRWTGYKTLDCSIYGLSATKFIEVVICGIKLFVTLIFADFFSKID